MSQDKLNKLICAAMFRGYIKLYAGACRGGGVVRWSKSSLLTPVVDIHN